MLTSSAQPNLNYPPISIRMHQQKYRHHQLKGQEYVNLMVDPHKHFSVVSFWHFQGMWRKEKKPLCVVQTKCNHKALCQGHDTTRVLYVISSGIAGRDVILANFGNRILYHNIEYFIPEMLLASCCPAQKLKVSSSSTE